MDINEYDIIYAKLLASDLYGVGRCLEELEDLINSAKEHYEILCNSSHGFKTDDKQPK